MTVRWIVVAHRGGARIFESAGPGKDWNLIEELPHPGGRLRAGEIETDRHGSAFESHRPGRPTLERHQGPTEHLAEEFAKAVASEVGRGRTEGRFDRLVLVAAPKFLGRLRAALDTPTSALVEASLDKDLPQAKPAELRKALAGAVQL